ncbi:hypothetical protein [Streptomyces sp. NRRL B-1347]|uniref:hypothetical protein n=1 Tax=Streptomyces sp. NRRL B-1347 TaxID=1476877 RepID=UPI000AA3F088|nr:hypothetical protein [Streptomyces sp. NRRL B-1347]
MAADGAPGALASVKGIDGRATADGRAASATMTREPKTTEALTHLEGVVDAALCHR